MAVVAASKAILGQFLSSTRVVRIPNYVLLLGLAVTFGANISPAQARRLTAIWDPAEGWNVLSSSKRGATGYLKNPDKDTRKIDYNSTDSATLATQQQGYATIVWYMANKKPINFASPPSKWSQKATLKWINSSAGSALIEKLKFIGDSHHTRYPDIYDSITFYFPAHSLR